MKVIPEKDRPDIDFEKVILPAKLFEETMTFLGKLEHLVVRDLFSRLEKGCHHPLKEPLTKPEESPKPQS